MTLGRLLSVTSLLALLSLGCATGDLQRPSANLPCTAAAHRTVAAYGTTADATVTRMGTQWIDDNGIDAMLSQHAGKMLDGDRDITSAEDLKKGLAARSTTLDDLPAGDEQVKTGEDLYDDARSAVALVGSAYKCQNCNEWHTSAASGFFIDSSGVLVTNYHVVDTDADTHKALFAMLESGRTFALKEVLAADRRADIAIVRVDPVDQDGNDDPIPALPLSQGARTGSDAYVLSHPDHRYFVFTRGIVSRRYLQRGTPQLSITADYARGSSGGPVLDDRGQVIGMVASTSSVYYDRDNDNRWQNLQMVWKQCVPVESIRHLIETPAKAE